MGCWEPWVGFVQRGRNLWLVSFGFFFFYIASFLHLRHLAAQKNARKP
ncbi:hypothetical protein CORC01_11066 [Colletotrichum orchidophilum]|uniref:Uncharacterized protein n=1 Tax=Colletotrichum orchidophilum TaxID=1209926 RepID=A0A1G4AX48_9PEZI|nr:uncharacterized protein CORC01_11066 [Colletotrichum orchidophilum]OHE93663.1 hypothetical protein CORC01_11066 [Colletotrichum orchidophilum]